MSTSNYAEVSLECPSRFPNGVEMPLNRLIDRERQRELEKQPASSTASTLESSALCSRARDLRSSDVMAAVTANDFTFFDKKVKVDASKISDLLKDWCASPMVKSDAQGNKSMDALTQKGPQNFPIYNELDEIVKALHTTDVVLLIAPTGSGKSILSPFIAEKLAQCSNLKGANSSSFRKSLLVVPNVEHCNSTARTFGNFFGSSKIALSAFPNPYEEKVPRGGDLYHKSDFSGNDGPAEFAICTYKSALGVLPNNKDSLNLLILDEVHDPNDNVQVTIAIALKKLLAQPFASFSRSENESSRKLNKLLLMTATLDENERENYEKYFTADDLSFKIVDLTDKLQRKKEITLSCLPGTPLPPMFVATSNSDRLLAFMNDDPMLRTAAASMDHNALHNRMRASLNFVMGLACENLRSRLNACNAMGSRKMEADMQSIIVILPGLDHVDRLYGAAGKLSNFTFDGLDAFQRVRLTSLVKDDKFITTKCSKRGHWEPDGHLGRIVFTTNLVAAGLTVPNAAYVIDSGVQKILSEYTKDGLKKLETTFIDKLMIIQRSGRTGRTTDGEYFLPYSVEKVDEMMNINHGELLLHRNFDERHALYTEVHELQLLHPPPARLRDELLDCMKIRGLYGTRIAFGKADAERLNKLFNFLTPEQARIVILGTRLGIAAHAIYIVADSISRVKFCQVGTVGNGRNYGPSVEKSATHLFAEAMDRGKNNDGGKWPGQYVGIGDSIALADLLVSFFSAVPCNFNRSTLNQIESSRNFWSGNMNRVGGWKPTTAEMYAAFVKDEGRDAVARYVSQIESCLRAADMLPPAAHGRAIFDKEFNRHLVSRDTFCLNEDGRALLAALLTIHSSRVCLLKQNAYRIYRKKPTEPHIESLFPESTYSQPTSVKEGEIIYGRYTDMFERKGKYCGLVDPITLKQLAFFLNMNGEWTSDKMNCTITLKLNASNAKRGIKIQMVSKDAQKVLTNVGKMRYSLAKYIDRFTMKVVDESTLPDLEELLFKLWKACGEQTETGRDEKDELLAAYAANALRHPPLPSSTGSHHNNSTRPAFGAARGGEANRSRKEGLNNVD